MRGRVVCLSIGALALTSACATSTGSMSGSRFDARANRTAIDHRRATREDIDSAYAQALADRVGPRARIYAEYTSFAAGGRQLRAGFHLEDDAYVLVGHVDSDGLVRIVFPTDPTDDGFVKGNRSYSTNQFFAGFTSQYRYNYNAVAGRSFQPDAYDGAGGYLFIVASWRPMHFEQFATAGSWDSFELTDDRYMSNPRPAIYEMASMLAGSNRESYSVEFAQYYNTMNSAPFSGFESAYGNSFCNGYGASPSFAAFQTLTSPFTTYSVFSDAVYYRGRQYYYDAVGGCYQQSPYGFYRGFGFGGFGVSGFGPVPPGTPTTGISRHLAAGDSPRKPFDPRPPIGVGHLKLDKPIAPTDGAEDGKHFSPEYRHRGLITEGEPGESVPAARAPRAATSDAPQTHPTIQQMVERRAQNQDDGSGWTRGRGRAAYGNEGAIDGGTRTNADPRSYVHQEPAGSGQSDARSSRPVPQDNARSAPVQRSEPRAEAPVYRPAPSSPPPSAPPPSHVSSPPPPASSSSGSSSAGSTPVKPPTK
jgi:hypothetical protein